MATSAESMNVQEDLLQRVIDLYLTDEVLSAIVTDALGVKTRCDGHTVLTGGCWNRVVEVATDGSRRRLVLKFTPKIGDDALRREYQVLQYFHASTAMPVPEPFLLDTSGERLPGSVLVMETVAGEVLSKANERLNDEQRRIIAEEIADHLVDLHGHQEAGFGGLEQSTEERSPTWMGFWVPRLDATIDQAQEKALMPDDLLAEISKTCDHLPQLLDIGPRGTLTHYDIWTGNVMVDVQDGRPRVTGYLDIGGYYADYARELSSMFSLADERLMQVYEQRHGLDEGFRARFDLYSMKMCLQLVCQYPSDPKHMENARGFLRKVQAYLERH